MTTITIESPPKTRREVLLDAAAIIEEHGWTEGAEGMPGNEHLGRYCILGAVVAALGYTNTDDYPDTYEEAGLYVLGPDLDAAVAYTWNDNDLDPQNPEWSARKVVKTLRRLADGAEWEKAIS